MVGHDKSLKTTHGVSDTKIIFGMTDQSLGYAKTVRWLSFGFY